MTHEVTNQPPPLTGSNAWRGDPLLIQIAEAFSAPARGDLDALGRFVLTPEAQDLARLANTETPQLRTHDRQGRRIDIVEFHPAYHALMRRSMASGLHSSIWENSGAETNKRHQVRAGRFYLTAQSDKLAMYEKLGFPAYGPELQDGGMPHRAMRSYDRDSAQLVD